MRDKPEKTKSFEGISKETFDSFLTFLSANRDEASERYLVLRSKIALYFRLRECLDPEDLADEVLARIIKKFGGNEGGVIADISSYSLGVAKNVLREYERSQRRLVSLNTVNEVPSTEEEFYRKQEEEEREQKLHHCLQYCLSRLTESNRGVLLNYYASNAETMRNREKISRELGITVNTLRVRVHRIRQSLHECIIKCLKD